MVPQYRNGTSEQQQTIAGVISAARRWAVPAALMMACTGVATAADYPIKVIRMITPFAAGGSTDLLSRTVAQIMNEGLRQSVVVENRPGGGAVPGSDIVAKAAPDGYTVLFGTVTTHGVNPSLYKKLPFDVQRDFAPISEIAYIPQLLSVHPSMPVRSVKELVALAKARPGEINYGAGGVGATPHMSMELFQLTAGIKMTGIQYRGSGPAMIGLLGGEVQVMFDVASTSIPHMKTGKIRSLAVTSLTRASVAPELPTISESGYPGFEAHVWFGLWTTGSTNPDIVKKVSEVVVAGLTTPKMKAYLTEQGFEVVASNPAEFTKRIAAEIAKWRKVIQSTGIKAEF